MKLQNVPLDQIASNPWRDFELYPIDKEHVAELRASINEHDFFASLKGRRRDGKVQIGCGHARVEAARKAGLETVPIFIDDIDDDGMLRLMVVENSTQGGAHAGAVMNEVAAATRRLIEGLIESDGTIVPSVAKAFESKASIATARTKLRTGSDIHRVLGHNVIRAYLGQGNPDKAGRGDRQIREAMAALKDSGRYDEIIETEVLKHPVPVADKAAAKGTAVEKSKTKKPRRILDERTANVFDNDHQFNAFREAVTTSAAQKVIPVSEQLPLAKSIVRDTNGDFSKKHAGAPYIKRMVQAAVEDGLKEQRKIDKEERDAYLAEQREERIDDELRSANGQLRGLLSSMARLADLAEQFPAHPKLGGFSARLDTLVAAIQQFSKKLK